MIRSIIIKHEQNVGTEREREKERERDRDRQTDRQRGGEIDR